MLSAKLWLLLAALEVARAPFEHAPLDGIVKHPDVKIGKGHGKGHGKKQKLEGPGSDEDAAVESPSAIFHKRKVALVTGITGMLGGHVAEVPCGRAGVLIGKLKLKLNIYNSEN